MKSGLCLMSGCKNGKIHSQHTWSSFLKGKYLFWWLPVDRNWNKTLLKPTANLDYWLQIDILFTFLFFSFFLTQPWFVMTNSWMLQPFLDKVDTSHGRKDFCKWSCRRCDQSFSARIKNKPVHFRWDNISVSRLHRFPTSLLDDHERQTGGSQLVRTSAGQH